MLHPNNTRSQSSTHDLESLLATPQQEIRTQPKYSNWGAFWRSCLEGGPLGGGLGFICCHFVLKFSTIFTLACCTAPSAVAGCLACFGFLKSRQKIESNDVITAPAGQPGMRYH